MGPATVAQMLALAQSALRLGLEGYAAAKRLQAEGYVVPGLDEFEARTAELRNRPDLAEEA